MPSEESLRILLLEDMPDAEVQVTDIKGTGDHFSVDIVSATFVGLSRIEQHRRVYAPLQGLMDDGSIHALSIKTKEPQSVK